MEKINLNKLAATSRTLDVAELQRLLRSDITKFWSWGSCKFINYTNRIFRFTVNGHHHKGNIYIRVNGSDLFDVYFTSSQNNIKDKLTDVYFEDLVELIDNKIERIDSYVD